MTRPLAHFDSHITNHSHIMTRPLAHFDSHINALAHDDRTTRTSPYSHSHILYSLAHYGRTTRTFRLSHHRTRTFHIHSHIVTGPLAHFDSHITNHSHIMTRPLAHFDSHINALAHYDRTTRTSPYSHSHISYSLAHYGRTTRTFRLSHHRTRTFHIHSHIVIGPLAHN